MDGRVASNCDCQPSARGDEARGAITAGRSAAGGLQHPGLKGASPKAITAGTADVDAAANGLAGGIEPPVLASGAGGAGRCKAAGRCGGAEPLRLANEATAVVAVEALLTCSTGTRTWRRGDDSTVLTLCNASEGVRIGIIGYGREWWNVLSPVRRYFGISHATSDGRPA